MFWNKKSPTRIEQVKEVAWTTAIIGGAVLIVSHVIVGAVELTGAAVDRIKYRKPTSA